MINNTKKKRTDWEEDHVMSILFGDDYKLKKDEAEALDNKEIDEKNKKISEKKNKKKQTNYESEETGKNKEEKNELTASDINKKSEVTDEKNANNKEIIKINDRDSVKGPYDHIDLDGNVYKEEEKGLDNYYISLRVFFSVLFLFLMIILAVGYFLKRKNFFNF